MRHQVRGRHFNRTSEHRRAMFRNLAAALFEHGQIETTIPKAKAVQPFIEKLITIAKRNNLHARRLLEQKLTDRRIHAWVADPNVPKEKREDNPYFDLPAASDIEFNRFGELRKAPRLVQHVMTNVAPRYEDRPGGYTRIVKLGKYRLGDGAELALLQLVGEEVGPEIGGGTSTRRKRADRRAEFAAQLRKSRSGGGGAAAASEADAAAEAAAEEEQAENATATAVADESEQVEETPAAEAEAADAETDSEKKEE